MKINIIFFLLCLFIYSCQEKLEFDQPLVFTGDQVNISDKRATFSGNISHSGNQNIQESGFIWSIHSQDDRGIKLTNEGVPTGTYSLETQYDLLPNKTFYVRAYAKTENGITYGQEKSFESQKTNEELNLGEWDYIYKTSTNSGYCAEIGIIFTIGNITYVQDIREEELFIYNHDTNEFHFLISNNIIKRASFAITKNDKAYIFSDSSFYEFNPLDNSFTQLAPWPRKPKRTVTGFLAENKLYVGLGGLETNNEQAEFLSYDLSSGLWEELAPFPGENRYYGNSFTLDGEIFICGGYYENPNYYGPYFIFPSDLWKYNIKEDSWSEQKSVVENDLVDDRTTSFASVGNFGYGLINKELYEYNPTFNYWEKMADNPFEGYVSTFCGITLFTYQNSLKAIRLTRSHDSIYFKIWTYEK